MAIADRAQETTNTTGTGTLTLAGAVAGYQSFTSAFATGTVVEYAILSGVDWEVGRGTFTTSGTTLSRTTVYRSSNSNALITVAAAAKVWADIGADNFTSSVQPFRNRLLNGAWRFDQFREGASAYTSTSGGVPAMDGWTGASTGTGVFSMLRVVDPDNPSLLALRILVTTADAAMAASDSYNVFQAIEGYNVADLKAGTASAAYITISFDMKFDVAGVYGIGIHNGSVARSYIGSVTQLVAGANESKVVTLQMDTTGTWTYQNGVGLYLRFSLAAGSTAQGTLGIWQAGNVYIPATQCNFMATLSNVGYIKRIQLEKGQIATPFEEVPYDADLARCQRYQCKSYAQGTAVGTATSGNRVIMGGWTYTGTALIGFRLPVDMRTTPTLTGYSSVSGTAGFWSESGAVDQAVTMQTGTAYAEAQVSTGSREAVTGHFYANARLS